MATNPYVNKVQLADGTMLMDISSDTVTADTLLAGTTAHSKSGAAITGTMAPQELIDVEITSEDAYTSPLTIYDNRITADHVVINNVVLNRANINYTTTAGSITLQNSDGISPFTSGTHLILGVVS